MVFPLPQVIPDVGPGGSVVTAMRGMNALQHDMLQNRYYAPINAANALSKLAYAQFAGPEAIAKFMSNQAVVSQMKPEELAEYKNMFHNAINGRNPFGMMGGPLMNQFLDALNVRPSQNSQQQSNRQVGNGLLQPPVSSNYQQNQPTSPGAPIPNPVMSPEEVGYIADHGNSSYNQPGGLPNTQVNRQAAQMNQGGAMGGYNPPAVNQAQSAALQTQATGEAQNNNDLIKKMTEDAQAAADQAPSMIALADKMQAADKKLTYFEEGPFFGKPMPVSQAATDYDTNANQLANLYARVNEQGRLTDTARGTYFSGKPRRDMPGESRKHQLEYIKSAGERALTKPAFIEAAKALNLTPGEINAIWNYFSSQKPFFDAEGNKSIPQNIDAWEQYLTPKKIKEALSPSARKKDNRNEKNSYDESEVEGRMPKPGYVWMREPGGKKHEVPESRVREALYGIGPNGRKVTPMKVVE